MRPAAEKLPEKPLDESAPQKPAMAFAQRRANPTLVFAALLTVQVLFGINYVTAKFVVGALPPLCWASVRLLIATAIMFASAWLMGRPHPAKNRSFFVPLIGFALLGSIINQASFLVGMKYTTPTNSAVLNTLIPIFTLLLVTLRRQEPLSRSRALGFVFALAGVMVIRRVDQFTLSDQTLMGDGLTVLNCLSYAFFLSFSKPFLEKHDRVWTTAWLFAYGTVGMSLLSIPSWQGFELPPISGTLLGCMVFSILGGTIGTYFLSLWALAHTRSSAVALFIYLQPVVAATVAWAWLGEIPNARVVASSLFILLGVYLGLRQQLAHKLPERRARRA